MRKGLAIATLTICLAGSTALAHGPSGSYEGSRDHRIRNNNVRCGKGTKVDRMTIYAASNGVEFCNDGGRMPVQGRAMVDVRRQYVAADGDRNNAGPLTGYARIDKSGVHCSDGRDQDAAHSRTAGKPTTCDAD